MSAIDLSEAVVDMMCDVEVPANAAVRGLLQSWLGVSDTDMLEWD